MLKKLLITHSLLSINHTGKILVGIMMLTLILGYQATSLQLQISFDYLLSDNNPRIETFNQILDEFNNDSNILLIASGHEDSLRSFAYHIKPILESFDKWVSSIHTQTSVEFLRKNILKLMEPVKLDNFGEIFYDPNLVPFLSNLNNAFENTYLHSENGIISSTDEQDAVDFLDRIHMFIRAQEDIMLETEAIDVGQKAVDAIVFGEGLHLSLDRNMLLIIIEPGFNMHLPTKQLLKNVDGIEEIVGKTADQHGIRAVLAGPLVKARDYYTAFLNGFWRISVLSMIGFSFILILSFRMWSIPIMCIITLIICIVWSLGIYSFFMKTINLISILALMLFVLLGIGNCILLIAGFLEKRKHGLNIEVSIKETLQRFGSGLFVSSSVLGLLCIILIFSRVKVLQDLGIMAGIGITTTMMVTIVLLPVMLILFNKLYGNNNPLHAPEDISFSFLGKAAQCIAKYRWVSIIFIVFITCFIFYRCIQMYMDTNLSDLALDNSDSINIENELIKSFGISSNLLSFTTDDLSIARIVTEQARNNKSIGYVESISDYIPYIEFSDYKFRYIMDLRRKIKLREVRKHLSSHDIKMYRKEIERLEANIIELQDFSLVNDQLKVYEKTIQLVSDGTGSSFQGTLSLFINALDTGMNRLKITYFQEQFSSAFKATVLEMANTEPLSMHNLPQEIKNRFIGNNDDIFRVNIYPHQNIWDAPTLLDQFIDESSYLNEKITGWPILFVELKDHIRYDAFKFTRLLLISMMLLLLLCQRSIKYTLIIMLSITVGLIWLLGVFMLFNTPISLMNIWIIPVILSISMNNTILILQRWKQEKNVDIVFRSTGKAILLTTVTILVMLLPICFTSYAGLTSIASILLVALVCSFLSHLIILPPFLAEGTLR